MYIPLINQSLRTGQLRLIIGKVGTTAFFGTLILNFSPWFEIGFLIESPPSEKFFYLYYNPIQPMSVQLYYWIDCVLYYCNL